MCDVDDDDEDVACMILNVYTMSPRSEVYPLIGWWGLRP